MLSGCMLFTSPCIYSPPQPQGSAEWWVMQVNCRALHTRSLPVRAWCCILLPFCTAVLLLQVLYVNMVTAVTMGMMLAAEPAEADIMNRPPRRPGKRLLGKLILWRCMFVSGLLVICVLGLYEWGNATGLSVPRRRAEAFNMLVFGEIAYSITTRYIKASCIHPRVFQGNPLAFVSIGVTAALQMLLTYTPGLNAFFSMGEGMSGIQWARVFVAMVAVFFIVEIEKALVDPVLMPMVRPVLDFISNHCPNWLRYPSTIVPDRIKQKLRKDKNVDKQ